jgi:hypothetical protein
VKRTKLKKESKQPISKLQKELWAECKRIVREQFENTCYTCGAKNLQGSNWQTGHMWAKASLGAYLKYDLRVLRPQCASCNLWHGGMGADFYKKMLKIEGKEYMEKLEQDRNITVKAYDHYLTLLKEYKTIRK